MIAILIVALTACSVIALVLNHIDAQRPVQNTTTEESIQTQKEAA